MGWGGGGEGINARECQSWWGAENAKEARGIRSHSNAAQQAAHSESLVLAAVGLNQT